MLPTSTLPRVNQYLKLKTSKNWRHTAFAMAIALLSACSSLPKTTDTSSPDAQRQSQTGTSIKSPIVIAQRPAKFAPNTTNATEYQQILLGIDHWQAQGKIGLKIPNNSGSLYFNWKQEADTWAIHLSGPLGQGATWIKGNETRVSLRAGDKPLIYAKSPEELMQRSLGWSLPIENLYYWLRGVASPLAPITSILKDESGQLISLSQLGWNIEFPRYKQHDGWLLPQKIIATNNKIKTTIIIKNWRLY